MRSRDQRRAGGATGFQSEHESLVPSAHSAEQNYSRSEARFSVVSANLFRARGRFRDAVPAIAGGSLYRAHSGADGGSASSRRGNQRAGEDYGRKRNAEPRQDF